MRLAGAMKEQAALGFRLTHQANHDALTGLPNRVLVVKHIDSMLSDSRRTGRPVALMFLDLDQFKLVNDSMGHAVGDQLLVQAAERIGNCVRDEDIVGRISGDELPHRRGRPRCRRQAAGLADRVRRVLRCVLLDAGEVFISVSIGIAIAFGTDVEEAATLIQEADTAMYRSKDAGRNAVTVYDTSMLERIARRVELNGASVRRWLPARSSPTTNRSSGCRRQRRRFRGAGPMGGQRADGASSEINSVAEESGPSSHWAPSCSTRRAVALRTGVGPCRWGSALRSATCRPAGARGDIVVIAAEALLRPVCRRCALAREDHPRA